MIGLSDKFIKLIRLMKYILTNKVYFTPEKANQILPKIRELVNKILVKQYEMDTVQKELDRMSVNGEYNHVYIMKESELQALAYELTKLVNELQTHGVVLKDAEKGLVDFPAIRLGDEVYLCWRAGEPEVSNWHGIHEGYAGRKKITEDEFIDPISLGTE